MILDVNDLISKMIFLRIFEFPLLFPRKLNYSILDW